MSKLRTLADHKNLEAFGYSIDEFSANDIEKLVDAANAILEV